MEIGLSLIMTILFITVFILNRVESRYDIRIMEAQMHSNRDLLSEIQREHTAAINAMEKSMICMIKDLQCSISILGEYKNKIPK
jgi:hypothetical protein